LFVPTDGSQSKLDLSKLIIKPLEKEKRAAFCCGNDKIDNFFRNNARDQHQLHKIRCYVALLDDVVVGYYYLVAQSVPPDHVSEEAIKKFGRVNNTPCVYLGMIGVNKDHQDNGIAKTLMVHAMRRTLEVANLIGIYALTLEAIDEDVAARYTRWGFKRFVEGDLAMFLPLATIKEVLKEG
jgi:GNAT superfamily N-acetyltransferase